MSKRSKKPQAHFLLSKGSLISDDIICSGKIETHFTGVCKYSDDGYMPGVKRIVDDRLGHSGDWAPKCALEQLGSLERWQENMGETYPQQFAHLRVFKCRQMLVLIVPGIRDDQASVLQDD